MVLRLAVGTKANPRVSGISHALWYFPQFCCNRTPPRGDLSRQLIANELSAPVSELARNLPCKDFWLHRGHSKCTWFALAERSSLDREGRQEAHGKWRSCS